MSNLTCFNAPLSFNFDQKLCFKSSSPAFFLYYEDITKLLVNGEKHPQKIAFKGGQSVRLILRWNFLKNEQAVKVILATHFTL